MTKKKGESLFLRLRSELDALTDEERVAFANSALKYALVKATSFDLPGDQKAIEMVKFKAACDSLAEEIKTWPGSLTVFSARSKTQS